MLSRKVQVINKLGLHARAAAKLVKLAATFGCDVRLARGEREVDAKSIMGVMMLAAGQGTEIEILAEGEQADVALDALEKLFADRFGEGE